MCAITAAQRVMCWGSNLLGMLDVGGNSSAVPVPTAMQGLCVCNSQDMCTVCINAATLLPEGAVPSTGKVQPLNSCV